MRFTKYISIIISSLSIINPAALAQEAAQLDDADIGLAGLKEAMNNPEKLAQMMADLQVRTLHINLYIEIIVFLTVAFKTC